MAKGEQVIMFLILDPSNKTGYIICRAQHKMKMQALFKNPKNFNTARTAHKNPVWGSTECGGSEPLYTPHADKAIPATKGTAVTNVENSSDFGRITQLLP